MRAVLLIALVLAPPLAAADVIFQDGFESEDLSAWSVSATDGGDLSVTGAAALAGAFGLQALVDDVSPLFVRDNSPAADARYQAHFRLHPNDFDPGEAAAHFRTRVFIAHDASNQRLAAVVLRRRDGVYSVSARVRLDDATRADTGFFVITGAAHTIALDWKRSTSAAANDGSFELLVDGVSQALLSGLDNSVGAVDYARLGALSVKTGASGTLYFDDFGSERPPTCLDTDGDGWTTCDGDCCDDTGLCPGAEPGVVNPGAFDIPGNSVDDDCDVTTADTAAPACDGGLASNSAVALDYARALDLCAFTVEAPPLAQKKWGVISGGFALADGSGTPAANSRSIRATYGTNVIPFAGNRLAVLSTGTAAAPGQTNPAHTAPQNGLGMGTVSAVPADWLAANGGTQPVTAGCPAAAGGGTANDPILLNLRVRVPTNAHSFSFRTFLYVSDFPEWTCSGYVDYFLALLDSQFVAGGGQSPNPADKNLAVFDPAPAGPPVLPVGGNLAYGDTGLFTQCQNGPIGCAGLVDSTISTCTGTALLQGTGFEVLAPSPAWCGAAPDQVGGGTGWLTVRGNVVPGETITLRLVVWDTSDALYDSVVLLDDFRWSTTSAIPGTTP